MQFVHGNNSASPSLSFILGQPANLAKISQNKTRPKKARRATPSYQRAATLKVNTNKNSSYFLFTIFAQN
jgi:hypothetical protein